MIVVEARLAQCHTGPRHLGPQAVRVAAHGIGIGRTTFRNEDVHAERAPGDAPRSRDGRAQRLRRGIAAGEEAESAGLGDGHGQLHGRGPAGQRRLHDRNL